MASGVAKNVYYAYAGKKLVAIRESATGVGMSLKYVLTDCLGGINVITDATGKELERINYDAFGGIAGNPTQSTRGYTDHEWDAESGLINMNARLYDPVLGRFISADTVIPEPGNMQAYNRYSYVLNNPLAYTDPTGHSWFSNLWKSVRSIVSMAIGAAVFLATGNPMLAGFISGFIDTGSLEGAIMGGISGAAFFAAGSLGAAAGSSLVGVAGGLMSAAQRGKFGQGFMSAAFSKLAGGIGGGKFGITGKTFDAILQRVTVSGVIGGVAARYDGWRLLGRFPYRCIPASVQ